MSLIMLREIKKVRQNPGEDKRRWFTDDYWDLYVWQSPKQEITGVQLAYGKPFSETAFTWIKNKRCDQKQIVEKKAAYLKSSGTATLTRKKSLNKELILKRFLQDSPSVEPRIVNLVRKVLDRF